MPLKSRSVHGGRGEDAPGTAARRFETDGCSADGAACEVTGTPEPTRSPSGFDRYPDFHSAHSGARIEFFGVALEEIRRFAGPRSGFLVGFGVPLGADGFDGLANPGNVPAMREDRVTLRGNADNSKFTEKTGEVADLDSAKIADGGRVLRAPAHAVGRAANLPGDFSEVRDKTLPLSGKVVHVFRGVIMSQAGDEQSLAVLESRWLEWQHPRWFCCGVSHLHPPVWWPELAWSVCTSHLHNAS